MPSGLSLFDIFLQAPVRFEAIIIDLFVSHLGLETHWMQNIEPVTVRSKFGRVETNPQSIRRDGLSVSFQAEWNASEHME